MIIIIVIIRQLTGHLTEENSHKETYTEVGSVPSALEMKICVANEILFIDPLKPVGLQTNVTPNKFNYKKRKRKSASQ